MQGQGQLESCLLAGAMSGSAIFYFSLHSAWLKGSKARIFLLVDLQTLLL